MSNNSCPICGEPAIGTARCPMRESYCKNSHTWHHSIHSESKFVGAAPPPSTFRAINCICHRGKGVTAEAIEATDNVDINQLVLEFGD